MSNPRSILGSVKINILFVNALSSGIIFVSALSSGIIFVSTLSSGILNLHIEFGYPGSGLPSVPASQLQKRIFGLRLIEHECFEAAWHEEEEFSLFSHFSREYYYRRRSQNLPKMEMLVEWS